MGGPLGVYVDHEVRPRVQVALPLLGQGADLVHPPERARLRRRVRGAHLARQNKNESIGTGPKDQEIFFKQKKKNSVKGQSEMAK